MDTNATELWLRAVLGDTRAESDLSASLTRRLIGYFRRRVQNLQDAEDLAQETLIRFFKNYNHRGAQVEPFLFTIARNLLISHLRKNCQATPTTAWSEEGLANPSTDLPHSDISAELIDQLHKCLAELNEKERDLLVAHFWCGTPYSEIANSSGVTESSVRATAYRANCKLRDCMGLRKTS